VQKAKFNEKMSDWTSADGFGWLMAAAANMEVANMERGKIKFEFKQRRRVGQEDGSKVKQQNQNINKK
jgi:hypothetical protein